MVIDDDYIRHRLSTQCPRLQKVMSGNAGLFNASDEELTAITDYIKTLSE